MTKSVRKNYLYNILYEILVIIIPLITSPYLSRILGADGIGIYTFQFSIVSYFILFAKLGIVNHGSREVAKVATKHDRSVLFFNILVIQIVASVLVLMSYAFYIRYICQESERLLACILTIQIVASAIDINWFFFGLEEFKLTSIRNMLIKIVNTALIFLLIKCKDDIYKYAFILAICQLFGQLLIWIKLKGRIEYVHPTVQEVKKNLKPILVLFIPTIAVSLYKLMDKIMLGGMASKVELGYYEYGSLFIGIPLSFITSLGTVMLPRISGLAEKGNIRGSLIYTRHTMLFVSALSFALSSGLAAIAPTLIPWYLGEEFRPSINILIYLSSDLIFLSWANVIRTQYLIPYRHDKEYIISLFCGAGLNLFINFLLIKRYGAMGAVIGTIAAEFLVCFMQTYFSRKALEIKVYLKQAIGFPIIAAIMFINVRLVATIHLPVIYSVLLQILFGAVIYTILSVIYLRVILKYPLRDIVKRMVIK